MKQSPSIDAKVLATIRAAYKWALKDYPDAEVCPNCHGAFTVKLNDETYPCPCQDKKKPDPAKTIAKTPMVSVSQSATSNAYRMDVAIEKMAWFYDDIMTQLHGCVLGMTGMGKTNTVYRIAEQILHAKGTVTIIDPEGDYRFLKSQFPILIVGKGRKGNPIDLPCAPDVACLLARKLASRSVSVILDLSGYDEEAKNVFAESYVGELWKQYQDEDLPPMRLVIDEVQLFAPEQEKTVSKKLFRDIASRGRKRHLVMLIVTQSPQLVDKRLLNAADIRIFHRLKRGTALNAIRNLLPHEIGDIQGKEIDDVFTKMLRGQATFEMEGQEPCLVTIKPSDTYHPQTGPLTQLSIPLQTIDSELIQELRRILGNGANSSVIEAVNLTDAAPYIADLESKYQQLCNEVIALRKQLDDKEAEIALLKTQPQITPVLSTNATDDVDFRSPLATARAVNKQQREFEQFLNSLAHQHSGAQQAMLKFLIQNDGNTYNLHEIARFSGYSVSTLAKLPQKLISGGYIWRQKGRKPIFKSTVRSRLAELYPDLNTEALVGEILKVCK